MHGETVTSSNSYRFADNFAIVRGENCYGCEHNEEEAKAIAAYLSNYHGAIVSVVRNGKDQVREAKALRNGAPFHVKNRDMILRDAGVWQ